MQTHLGENAAVWSSGHQCFISSNHEKLAEILHEYNPHFSLVFIPPKDRDATDTKPFAILDSSPARPPYIMRYLSEREMENPSEILAWIFNGDMSKHRPIDVFQRLQNEENAKELLKLKDRQAAQEEAEDFGEYIFGEGLGHAGFFAKHNGQTYRR